MTFPLLQGPAAPRSGMALGDDGTSRGAGAAESAGFAVPEGRQGPAALTGIGFTPLLLALLGGDASTEGEGHARPEEGGSSEETGVDTPRALSEGSGSGVPAAPGAERVPEAGRSEGPAGAPSGGVGASITLPPSSDVTAGPSAPSAGRPTRAGWMALAGGEGGRDAGSAPGSAAVTLATPTRGTPDEGAGAPGESAEEVRVAVPAAGAEAAEIHAPRSPAPPGPVSGDVGVADRSPDRLHPELREKVERVIERMASEHGIQVRLTEGYRTPERQRHLYAQGRTRPGPVVTWTTDSLHSRGRAADLKVEGPWDQTRAYALLQRVAEEEGLGTLGMKDPGHVELQGEGDGGARRFAGVGSSGLLRRGVEGVHVAEAAPAARVARTAPAAEPARVASPALAATPGAASPAGPEPRRAREGGTLTVDSVGGDGPPEGTRVGPLPGGEVAAREARPSPVTLAAPSVSGVDTLDGVERARELRAVLDASPAQRVSLRLDGGGSVVERVRVDLVDRALRGSVDVSDAALASRLRGDAATLLRTLDARGFENPSLRIGGTVFAAAEGGAELLGTASRAEGVQQALRSLLGETSLSGARGGQEPGTGEHRGREGRPDGSQRETRKDHRREDR